VARSKLGGTTTGQRPNFTCAIAHIRRKTLPIGGHTHTPSARQPPDKRSKKRHKVPRKGPRFRLGTYRANQTTPAPPSDRGEYLAQTSLWGNPQVGRPRDVDASPEFPPHRAVRAARATACPATMPSNRRSHMPLWLAPSGPVIPDRSSTMVHRQLVQPTSRYPGRSARFRNVSEYDGQPRGCRPHPSPGPLRRPIACCSAIRTFEKRVGEPLPERAHRSGPHGGGCSPTTFRSRLVPLRSRRETSTSSRAPDGRVANRYAGHYPRTKCTVRPFVVFPLPCGVAHAPCAWKTVHDDSMAAVFDYPAALRSALLHRRARRGRRSVAPYTFSPRSRDITCARARPLHSALMLCSTWVAEPAR